MKKFKNRPNRCVSVTGQEVPEVWISRSPAVVAVVIAEYQHELFVLIGKRGEGAADFQGFWNVPCGYLDWDETGQEGMYREVYEETGLYIPDIPEEDLHLNFDQPFFVNTDPKENRQNVSLSYGIYFRCKELPKLSNDFSEPGEVEELKWLKVKELENYKFAFSHDERIKMFLNYLDMSSNILQEK